MLEIEDILVHSRKVVTCEFPENEFDFNPFAGVSAEVKEGEKIYRVGNIPKKPYFFEIEDIDGFCNIRNMTEEEEEIFREFEKHIIKEFVYEEENG